LGLLLTGAALAFAIGVAAYVWMSSSFRAVAVETTTVALITEGQALTVLSASGYVEAETRADLSPKITSRITDLRVTEGSRVRKGEIIARLDHFELTPPLIVAGVIFSLAMGLFGGLFPAARAARLKITSALREA
ncbi:MAG: biotin/lipoyl-binding protein, partial [Acidobacteriota bacterium]